MWASLKTQTWTQFEVIILDHSGDPQLKQKFADEIGEETFYNWKVLGGDSTSQAEIFNRALSKAQGKYIVSLRSGDELVPTFLEKCLLLLEASPPHFFIKSVNQPFGAEERESLEIVDPIVSLRKNLFRAVVFPRSAGLEVSGYNETLPAGSEEWEFYVKLIRYGYVGHLLSERLYHHSSSESVLSETDNVAAFAFAKERIQALHLGFIVNHERYLCRRARQYWRVSESLCNLLPCNLLPSAGELKKTALWLDLVGISFEPWRLFPQLLARPDDRSISILT